MKILLTGGTGFIGRHLAKHISLFPNLKLSLALRSPRSIGENHINEFVVGDLSPVTNWEVALTGQEVVIHAAARAHLQNIDSLHAIKDVRISNVYGTLNLARQAADLGVKRFIFISTVGVNGSETDGKAFSATDHVSPHSVYAFSKYEAEVGLRELSLSTGMEVVIIRPPLVYGQNAPGNFGFLLRVLSLGIPLPFGSVSANRRSFVGVDNLISLIMVCLRHPRAANSTFLVSDGEDLSTADLINRLGVAIGKPVRMINVPSAFLHACAKFIGKDVMAKQLLGSLQVDITHTCQTLGWKPQVTVNDGLRRAVEESSL